MITVAPLASEESRWPRNLRGRRAEHDVVAADRAVIFHNGSAVGLLGVETRGRPLEDAPVP